MCENFMDYLNQIEKEIENYEDKLDRLKNELINKLQTINKYMISEYGIAKDAEQITKVAAQLKTLYLQRDEFREIFKEEI